MLNYGGYPKVYVLGHKFIEELLLDEVTVEEKVDGSQFSFALDPADPGEPGVDEYERPLRAWSHHQPIDKAQPDKLFELALGSVRERAHLLVPGWVYRAEYLQKPKHHTLAYGRIPQGHLMLFDVETAPSAFLDRVDKAKEAERIGVDVAPTLYYGRITSPDQVRALLDTESFLGGPKIEGVVIKNYARCGRDGKVLMGKYVSEAFKEIAKIEWKKPGRGDIVWGLITSLNTPARWEKAVQRLREEGRLQGAPQDIGPLMALAKEDVRTEAAEWIRDELYKALGPLVMKGIGRGLPEWYKQKLLEAQPYGESDEQQPTP